MTLAVLDDGHDSGMINSAKQMRQWPTACQLSPSCPLRCGQLPHGQKAKAFLHPAEHAFVGPMPMNGFVTTKRPRGDFPSGAFIHSR
jgi:hypothetical protein